MLTVAPLSSLSDIHPSLKEFKNSKPHILSIYFIPIIIMKTCFIIHADYLQILIRVTQNQGNQHSIYTYFDTGNYHIFKCNDINCSYLIIVT